MLIPDKSNEETETLQLKLFRRSGESLNLTTQQMKALERTLSDDRIQFYLFATPVLIQDLTHCRDENLRDLPAEFVSSLINKQGILFNQNMLIQYAKGELDERNRCLLERCDIKYTHYIPAILLDQ